MTDSEKDAAPACPICGKPRSDAYSPFCSKRCADVDLNRWLSGGYVIAGKRTDEADSVPEDSEGE
ncbi:MAG: DNA gyrase inhibitor YacG [Flavobacteriaceae bacterium]